MMKGKAKIVKHPKCDTLYVSIPAKVASDSAFPFEVGDKITVEISFDRVILSKTS